MADIGSPIKHARALKGLWIENPDDIENKDFPHSELDRSFEQFLKRNNLLGFRVASCTIIQDKEDKRYLLLDPRGIIKVNSELRRSLSKIESYWTQLAVDYRIEAIIGEYKRENAMDNPDHIKIIDSDLIGRLREAQYLLSIAQRYKMTISQYLRLRILSERFMIVKEAIIYERLAKDIVNLDQ